VNTRPSPPCSRRSFKAGWTLPKPAEASLLAVPRLRRKPAAWNRRPRFQEPIVPAPRPDPHSNRESRIDDVARRLRPAFAQLGAPLPERLRIAIGFPTTGRRAKATGECWDSAASADGTFETLVRPDLAEAEGAPALPVAAALARELVHAAVGIEAGMGPAYRAVARGIGLVGPMRTTNPGPAFMALVAPVLDAAGPLPHARLQADRDGAAGAAQDGSEAPLTTGPCKQASRHVRCACLACGYVVRTARKWLDSAGPPHCSQHGPMRPEHATLALGVQE